MRYHFQILYEHSCLKKRYVFVMYPQVSISTGYGEMLVGRLSCSFY